MTVPWSGREHDALTTVPEGHLQDTAYGHQRPLPAGVWEAPRGSRVQFPGFLGLLNNHQGCLVAASSVLPVAGISAVLALPYHRGPRVDFRWTPVQHLPGPVLHLPEPHSPQLGDGSCSLCTGTAAPLPSAGVTSGSFCPAREPCVEVAQHCPAADAVSQVPCVRVVRKQTLLPPHRHSLQGSHADRRPGPRLM